MGTPKITKGDPDDPGKKAATPVAPPPTPAPAPRPTPVEAAEHLEDGQSVILLVLFKNRDCLRLGVTAIIASSVIREFERQCGRKDLSKSPSQPLVLSALKQSHSLLTLDSSEINGMLIEEAFSLVSTKGNSS